MIEGSSRSPLFFYFNAADWCGKSELTQKEENTMANVSAIMNFSGSSSFMLNSSPSKIVVKGITFRNAETLYYASLCSRDEERVRFSKLSAFDARTLAQNADLENNFSNEERIAKMRSCIKAKFIQPQNWDLAQKLVGTGDRELVNGNTSGDTFWGVSGGKGDNYLGKILMVVRDFLKANPEYTKQRKGNPPAAPVKPAQVPAPVIAPAVAPKGDILVAKVVFNPGGKVYTYNTKQEYEHGATLEVETSEGFKWVTCCECKWTTKESLEAAGIYSRMQGKGILREIPKQDIDELTSLKNKLVEINKEKVELEKRISALESSLLKCENRYSYV